MFAGEQSMKKAFLLKMTLKLTLIMNIFQLGISSYTAVKLGFSNINVYIFNKNIELITNLH